ncbi:SDR family NAD(P)-dependent oxidoreductase [Pelomonas sp. SE-A7]|uniref:SDR family NAD(P)-dependent oxidoreductase n=1 Tax=Pelomonas sp. SE-A7 TaxID=3054953 RepID=UPI00259C8490|nr:SDR family NAD(P)-dependent oxidoreductase [Pelomonas sp. SE-A7]MDM4764625.1 SDR family NAD(P)-dependent oxidoreductase [Pelomonas sp. SE-A7]
MKGKRAIVTGGGSGIGAAIATSLLAEGVRVTLMGRSLERLEKQQALLMGEVAIQVCDVADEASVKAAFAAAGGVDILVNNAGQVETAPLARTSLETWQRLLQVNLTGTFLCCREALPGMLEQGFGRIINVASTAALRGYAYVAAYSAAKHGVLGLTRSLALELAKKGDLTVNAVCPGYTETEIVENAIATIQAKTGRSAAEARAELAASNPQGRLIQPEEVAAAVLWLARRESGSITGQAIAVSGGETM